MSFVYRLVVGSTTEAEGFELLVDALCGHVEGFGHVSDGPAGLVHVEHFAAFGGECVSVQDIGHYDSMLPSCQEPSCQDPDVLVRSPPHMGGADERRGQ